MLIEMPQQMDYLVIQELDELAEERKYFRR